jgi:hypothetical protein
VVELGGLRLDLAAREFGDHLAQHSVLFRGVEQVVGRVMHAGTGWHCRPCGREPLGRVKPQLPHRPPRVRCG